MLSVAAERGLRALCVALAAFFVLAVVALYVPAFRAGATIEHFQDVLPMLAAVFALMMPSSYLLRIQRQRETTMMIASFGWAAAMAAWHISRYAGMIANGFSVEVILREGFPGNLLNCVVVILLLANALFSLKSLRQMKAQH